MNVNLTGLKKNSKMRDDSAYGTIEPGTRTWNFEFRCPSREAGNGFVIHSEFVNVPYKEHRVGGTTVVYLVIASHVEHSHVTFSNTKL